MRTSTHYNDVVIVEIGTEKLTAEGREMVWESLGLPYMASVRFEDVKSKADNSSTIEVAEGYIVAFRDNILGGYPLRNFRIKYGGRYLYPITYPIHQGGEYRTHFSVEDTRATATRT